MSKDNLKVEKVEKVETVVSIDNSKQGLAIAVNNAVASGNIGNILKNATPKGFSMTSDFLKMEDGETMRFAVMEFGTVTVKDEDSDVKDAKKDIDCIYMVNEHGTTVIAPQTIIVNTLKSQVPCLVQITSTGKGGNGNRKYDNFDILPLEA